MNLVPGAGLEPARPKGQRILSPLCLPISPSGQKILLMKYEILYVHSCLLATFYMIIPIILVLSCLRTNSSISDGVHSDGILLFSMNSKEWDSTKNDTLQENAQMLFLKGLQDMNNENFIQSRSFGIQCLQEISPISFSQVEAMPILWGEVPVRSSGECIENAPSLLLPIPSNQLSTACVTWALSSWSQLLLEYKLRLGSMNAKSIIILSTWLEEHHQCLDSPWVSFAIATGFLYGRDITEHKAREQERHQYAYDLILSLWDHPELGGVVRYWYIRYRLQEGDSSKEEREAWILSIGEEKQIERRDKLIERLKEDDSSVSQKRKK